MRLWWNTAAFVFTHCLGTSPGRYGHAMVEQGQTVVLSGRRLAVPLSGPGWSRAALWWGPFPV